MESTTQIFLRVQVTDNDDDFVAGESKVGEYADRVQINSFDFKASQPQMSASNRAGQPSRMFLDTVKASKFFDKTSLRFDQLMKDKKVLCEVRITVDQHLWDEDKTKTQNSIIVFHLLQAKIVEISLDASEADKGTSLKETLEFGFVNFSVDYYFHESDANADYRDRGVSFFTAYDPQK